MREYVKFDAIDNRKRGQVKTQASSQYSKLMFSDSTYMYVEFFFIVLIGWYS